MRAAWMLGALLLQAAGPALNTALGPVAEPLHLRWERAIVLPAHTLGDACAVLDASVFAHASDRSANDLRVFDGGNVEVPFLLTESSPQTVGNDVAEVQNLSAMGDRVVFDLRMPARAYSEVDLGLNAKDFVAVAEVEAPTVWGREKLGSFTLFDLSSQHLSRSTALNLAEATYPLLHVTLRFTGTDGKPLTLAPNVLQGATVPPSRQAQTLYTTVASTRGLAQQGRDTVARIAGPAHVPVERVRVVLDPAFDGNFVRDVTITARDGAEPEDRLDGTISRAVLEPRGLVAAPPVRSEKLGVDAVLAANLYEDATVTVTVHNGDDKPLPMKAVELRMHERKLCFGAEPGRHYTLRYGDPALKAPQYDFARLFDANGPSVSAALGPEVANPHFTPRKDVRPYFDRHPEVLWVALFGVVAVLGATALASARRQRGAQS